MPPKKLLAICSAAVAMIPTAFAADSFAVPADAPGRWSREKAEAWYAKQPWLAGCNFIPSTAINQLEMWQADTFDEPTIDRELGLAESLGFNTVRVFLHDLLWKQDSAGFLKRIDRFLGLADKHHIRVMFVLFDSCWNPHPAAGPQPTPIPHTHNSGWVQSPGIEALQNPSEFPYLKDYVTGVVGRFANDPRVIAWDIWNEPDNGDAKAAAKRGYVEPKNKPQLVNVLLPQAFAWAREANPSQPLTSAVWRGLNDAESPQETKRIQIANSDVISFHCYKPLETMIERVAELRAFGRPILCTEFMSRPSGSTFDPLLGYMKGEKIGAYCWGFVAGKTQTNYPWDSWKKTYTEEPPVWFHDIFRKTGEPYRPEEVRYIRALTGVTQTGQ